MQQTIKYINVHTHHSGQPGETVICSLYNGFEQVQQPGHYTIGLHPWYLQQPGGASWKELEQWARHPNVVGIGECGLDKVCTTDFQLQQELFKQQILLANQLGKPLVLHCVRAFAECQAILHSCKNEMPVLFHGFQKSLALALELTGKGFFLSLGAALQRPQMQEVLRQLPLDKVLLETDDTALSVAGLYPLAASICSLSEYEFSLHMQQNAAVFFKDAI